MLKQKSRVILVYRNPRLKYNRGMNNIIYPNFPDPIQHPNRHWKDFTPKARGLECGCRHTYWTNTVKDTTSCLRCGLVPA